MTQTVLSAVDVDKSVAISGRELLILQGINLEIKTGESLAILGASGSGKTTLLSLMAGLDQSSKGEIYLLGHPLSAANEAARALLRRQYVGFVFQNFQLLNSLTALENIVLPMELKNISDAAARGAELLEQVGIADRATHYPKQLSGGEQQRVALARAFAGKPAILFADEPTGNLDADTSTVVSDLMFELNKSADTTLVLVTHDEVLAGRCKRCLRLHAGRLVGS